MARTLTISLGNELYNYAQQLVNSGAYASVSEVVCEALTNLREQKASSNLERLRSMIDGGNNSGEPVDLDVAKFLSQAKLKTGKTGKTGMAKRNRSSRG